MPSTGVPGEDPREVTFEFMINGLFVGLFTLSLISTSSLSYDADLAHSEYFALLIELMGGSLQSVQSKTDERRPIQYDYIWQLQHKILHYPNVSNIGNLFA